MLTPFFTDKLKKQFCFFVGLIGIQKGILVCEGAFIWMYEFCRVRNIGITDMATSDNKIFGGEIKNRSAFTVVELIMVMGIIAIMAAVVFPNFKTWMTEYELRSAARDVFSSMQKAKMVAIQSNTSVSFSFTSSTGSPCQGGSYTFTDSSGKLVASNTFGHGICLSTTAGYPNGFRANGLPLGTFGGVVLSHPAVSKTYSITQTVAGGIRLQ